MDSEVINEEKLRLFRSIFRGRSDVYAVRWEKEGKAGYMPAYEVDWEKFREHKSKGGTFKNLKDKTPKSITDFAINAHLSGQETIGIYPLLEDNSSYFIAADFDKKSWLQDCKALMDVCTSIKIPCYLERSRSGNGGHVWIFFKEPYAAEQSRKILFVLLRKAGLFSEFEKEESFDRLFPNQNFHSGKGYGNLIALPLNGKSVQNGNSAFIDPETQRAFPDQWDFLRGISKISKEGLEHLFQLLIGDEEFEKVFSTSPNKEIEIHINSRISIPKNQATSELIGFLRENLNIPNPQYVMLKKMGKSTYKTEPFFRLIEEDKKNLFIPRGFRKQLFEFLQMKGLQYKLIDQRAQPKTVVYKTKIDSRPEQKEIVNQMMNEEEGILVAPPGSGKTIMALDLISQKGLPALILVHRKQLLDQWMERIQSFLKIPKARIGKIEGNIWKVGKEITVAMIQTLHGKGEIQKIANSFGVVIVDECHHLPAKTFRETISVLNPRFIYGLTATPIRKNRDEALIFTFIGPIVASISQSSVSEQQQISHHLIIRETGLKLPFDFQIENFDLLSNFIVFDSERNLLISKDIEKEVKAGRKILVLTERRSHIEVLKMFLKGKAEVISVSGEDSENQRKKALAQIKSGNFQVLISTGQFAGEGIDIKGLDCLFLVFPFSFEGKLTQYIGRIGRQGGLATIYDYHDSEVEFLDKMLKKRKRASKKLGLGTGGTEATLF